MVDEQFLGLVMVGRLGNHIGTLAAGLAYAWDNNLPLKCPQLGNFPTPLQVDQMLEPLKKDFLPETFYWPGMCNGYFPVYERLLSAYPDIASGIPENKVSIYQVHMQHHYRDYPVQPNMVFVGYFFNEKYFIHHRERIKELFQPTDSILAYLNHKYSAVINDPKSVGIQLRDYTNDGDKWVDNLTKRYFQQAVDAFDDSHRFYVCTHNKEYAKQLFNELFAGTAKEVFYIEHEQDFIDFYFLTRLKNLIISNSSFGWWAAYLCPHEDKRIIAPEKEKWLRPEFDSKGVVILPETEVWTAF